MVPRSNLRRIAAGKFAAARAVVRRQSGCGALFILYRDAIVVERL
jgi:hypothetical protein